MGIQTVVSPQTSLHDIVSLKHRGASSNTSELLNTAFYHDTTDSEIEMEFAPKDELSEDSIDHLQIEYPFLFGICFPIFLNIIMAILISSTLYFSGASDVFNYTVYLLTKDLVVF